MLKPGYGHEDNTCGECGSNIADSESGCLACGAKNPDTESRAVTHGSGRMLGRSPRQGPAKPTPGTAEALIVDLRRIAAAAKHARTAAQKCNVPNHIIADLEKIESIAAFALSGDRRGAPLTSKAPKRKPAQR